MFDGYMVHRESEESRPYRRAESPGHARVMRVSVCMCGVLGAQCGRQVAPHLRCVVEKVFLAVVMYISPWVLCVLTL